jgi:hypothetical protein
MSFQAFCRSVCLRWRKLAAVLWPPTSAEARQARREDREVRRGRCQQAMLQVRLRIEGMRGTESAEAQRRIARLEARYERLRLRYEALAREEPV